MEDKKVLTIEVEEASPKTKSDGSFIMNRFGRKLYSVKAKGVATKFETWSDTIGEGVGKSFEVEVEKKESEYNGNTYTNYYIKQTQDSSKRGGYPTNSGGYKGKSVEEIRSIEIQVCLKEANLFYKDRLDNSDDDVIKTAEKYYGWILKRTKGENPTEKTEGGVDDREVEQEEKKRVEEEIDINELPF